MLTEQGHHSRLKNERHMMTERYRPTNNTDAVLSLGIRAIYAIHQA